MTCIQCSMQFCIWYLIKEKGEGWAEQTKCPSFTPFSFWVSWVEFDAMSIAAVFLYLHCILELYADWILVGNSFDIMVAVWDVCVLFPNEGLARTSSAKRSVTNGTLEIKFCVVAALVSVHHQGEMRNKRTVRFFTLFIGHLTQLDTTTTKSEINISAFKIYVMGIVLSILH